MTITLVMMGTRWAPWGYSDGVGYLVSARNLMKGVGLGLTLPSGSFEPLVSHPPLYPSLLAMLSSLGLDLFSAARLIDIVSFFTFVVFSGYLLLRITNEQLASVSFALLLSLTPGLVLIFISAMAEPLFFALGFPGLLLFARYLQKDHFSPLIASSFLIGAAVATRYPAISMVGAGLVALFLTMGFSRKSLISGLVFGGVAMLPISIFLFWSQLASSAASPRALASGENSASLVVFARQLLSVIWSWKPLPPSNVTLAVLGAAMAQLLPMIVIGLVIGGLLLLLPLQNFKTKQPNYQKEGEHSFPRPLRIVLIAFVLNYLGLLLAAYFGTYPTPDIDFRTLLPLLPALLLLAVFGLNHLRELGGGQAKHTLGFIVLIGAVALGYAVSTTELVMGHYRTGAGYTSRAWQQSELIKRINELPLDHPLVSNHPEAILLYLNRYPFDLDVTIDATGSLPEECPSRLISLVQEQDAEIALFELTGDPSEHYLDYSATSKWLQAHCRLGIISEAGDGIILGKTID